MSNESRTPVKQEANDFSGSDFSIECAKAYTSNSGDSASLEALRDKIENLTREGKTFSIALLVDDVSYPDKTFDFDEYASWLGSSGYGDAAIYRESQIRDSCEEVLKVVDESKLAPDVVRLVRPEQEGIYSSQLFIASWFLLRLGYIESSIFPTTLQANQLYNILPESFKPGEDESLAIIQATPYSQAVSQVEYQFIPE